MQTHLNYISVIHYGCLVFLTLIISEFQCLGSSRNGHYRCAWHVGPAQLDEKRNATTPSYKTDQSACSREDGSRLTSYINHCTKQNYVPLLACGEDGTWNCQSFISLCKTLIHTETVSAMEHDPLSKPSLRHQDSDPSQTGSQKESVPTVETNTRAKMFSPDENYFTMKEMAIAVLVSFITGATVLAVVICVVWRCRHSHLNSEQMRDAALQSAKRLAAIHAITHIAHAIGGGQDSLSSSNFSNPQYGQVIASRDILEDAMYEHDRIYEEIFNRRKSSCKTPDTLYASINNLRKKPPLSKQNSLTGELGRIDESAEESDAGYEADSNATPQPTRKPIYNLGNLMPNASRSPAVNAKRFDNNDINGDVLSKPFRNNVCNNSSHVGVYIEDIGDVLSRAEVNKCDSGYHDELSEEGLEIITKGDNRADKLDNPSTGERKQSLRL